MSDLTLELQEQVRQAVARKQPLELRGGGTKAFYGGEPAGELLEVKGHSGVVNYEPRELVLTADPAGGAGADAAL